MNPSVALVLAPGKPQVPRAPPRAAGTQVKILYFGGATTHLEKFVRTFSARHEVRVAAFGKTGLPGELLVGGRARVTRWTPALAVPLLGKVIERERPDVLHSLYLLPFSFLAARAGARRHVISPFGQDIYPPARGSRLVHRMLHLTRIPRDWHLKTASGFDAAVVECGHARRRLAELGYPEEKIEVITWGPDCTVFRPEAREQALRERLLRGGSALVVCTRKFWKVYGVQDLLAGFARVGGDSRLVLLGTGPDEAALRRRASRPGLRGRVEFAGGVSPGEVARFVASTDILVSPSRADTISTALLEGMACGLPVVSTDVGGTREFVDDGVNGLLVPPGRPDALASALERLLGDPGLRKRLGAAARETVLEKADWSRRWREVEQVYERVARR